MKRIVMTGITGLVGSAVAVSLLKKDKYINIITLVRGSANKNAFDRVKETIVEQCAFDGIPEFANEALTRIQVFRKNISSPFSSNPEIESLEDIYTIFHCAASVNLGKDPYGTTYIDNYQGTKNMLALAGKLGVKSYHQVSTAYVAGKAEGIVYEDGLVPNIEFNNSYEKSKYNAEKLVRNSGLAFTIYRPSIVVGRISDGKIRKPLAFYRILEFLGMVKKHQCSKLNIQPSQELVINLRLQAKFSDKIYFVPIDYTQETISNLFFLPPSNKTYHITGRGPACVTDIEGAVRSALKVKGFRLTEILDMPTIKEKMVNRFLGDLLPYFSTDITFDIKNVIADTKGKNLDWKIDRAVLDKIVLAYYRNVYPEILKE